MREQDGVPMWLEMKGMDEKLSSYYSRGVTCCADHDAVNIKSRVTSSYR